MRSDRGLSLGDLDKLGQDSGQLRGTRPRFPLSGTRSQAILRSGLGEHSALLPVTVRRAGARLSEEAGRRGRDGTDTDGVAELTCYGMAQPVTAGVDEPLVVLTPFGKAHTGSKIRLWTFRERLTQVAIAGVASGAAYAAITFVGYRGILAALGFAVAPYAAVDTR